MEPLLLLEPVAEAAAPVAVTAESVAPVAFAPVPLLLAVAGVFEFALAVVLADAVAGPAMVEQNPFSRLAYGKYVGCAELPLATQELAYPSNLSGS